MPKIDLLTQPIVWSLDFEALFLLEIPTERLRSFLPPSLHPFEIRPGISTIGLGLQIFNENNLDRLPRFREIYWAAMIASQLSYLMPVPNFSMYVGQVAADCTPFLDHAYEVDKMPVYKSSSLVIDIDVDNYVFSARDDEGVIVELAVSKEAIQKEFYQDTLWGQQISPHGDQKYIGAWKWQGVLYEYQKNTAVGKLYSHPFFSGLDVEGVADNCHMQIFTPPQQQDASLAFYKPHLHRR